MNHQQIAEVESKVRNGFAEQKKIMGGFRRILCAIFWTAKAAAEVGGKITP